MKQTMDFIIELIKHRRFILVSLIISSVIAIIMVFVVPVSYTASIAVVPPEDSKQSLLGSLSEISKLSSAGLSGGFMAMTVDLYSDVLGSDIVTDSIINKHDLMNKWGIDSRIQTRKKLKKKTHINITNSQMLTIAVTDKNPDFAAQICNDYVYYLDMAMIYIDNNKTRDQLNSMNKLLEEEREYLKDRKEALINWQRKNGKTPQDLESLNPALAILYSKLAEEQLDYYIYKREHSSSSKTLEKQRRLIESIEHTIDSTISKLKVHANDQISPEEAAKYLIIRSELQSAIETNLVIERRIKQIKSEILGDNTQIYTLGVASIPDMKSFPPRKIIVIIVFLLVLITDILIFGIKYYFERNYSDKQREVLKESIKRIFNDPFQLKKK